MVVCSESKHGDVQAYHVCTDTENWAPITEVSIGHAIRLE